MNIPGDLMYTKEHEWVKISGGEATAGITDYAQSSLGDLTFVELPAAGKELKQFGEMAAVESVKAASSVYSPLSGKVLKVNGLIADNPGIVNQSPYDNGWLVVLSIIDESEKKNLMDSRTYEEFVKGLKE